MTLTKVSSAVRSIGSGVKPSMKNMMWMSGGVVLSIVITVSAQQSPTPVASSTPCDIPSLVQQVVNNKVSMVAATSPDPDKYFNQNCLGDLSFASLDLSVLIPDPLSLLTGAVMAAFDNLKKAAMNKICMAERNAVADTIGRFNTVIGQVNGTTGYINTGIASYGQQVSDQFNTGYNTPSTTISVVTTPPSPTTSTGNVTYATPGATPGAQAAKTVGGSVLGGR